MINLNYIFLPLFIFVLLKIYRYILFRSAGEKIPGPPAELLSGNRKNLQASGPSWKKFWTEQHKKYGPVVRIWLGPFILMVVTNDPTYIEKIYTSKILHRNKTAKKLFSFLGKDSISMMSEERALAMRTKILPIISGPGLNHLMKMGVEKTRKLLDNIADKEIDILPIFSNFILDLVSEAFFGNKVCDDENGKIFVPLMMPVSHQSLKWLPYPIPPYWNSEYRKWKRDIVEMHARVSAFIIERLKGPIDENDFLALLLTDKTKDGKRSFTNNEVRCTTFALFFGSYETTALTLTWVLHLLSHNPSIQDEIRKELGKLKGSPTYDDIKDLKYIEAVIYETFRIVMPLAFNREILEDVQLGEYLLPKGTHIQYGAYGVGENPDVYEHPEQFKPERFLGFDPEIERFKILPFGIVPRICPGRRLAMSILKLIIASICLRFDLIPQEGSKQDIETRTRLFLEPKNPILITLKSR